jgi:hypothetical protein
MVGEVHADGEIIGSLSWTIRTDLGQAKGDKVVWGAISLLTPGATFGDFGRGLTQAATDLMGTGDLTQADVDKVKQDIAARGVNDCDQELAIDGTSTRTTNIIGLDLIGQFIGGNCQAAQNQGIAMQSLFHFSRKTVAADSAVRFHIDVVASTPDALAYTVYIRKAKHVNFGTSGFPAPDKFDAKFDFTTPSGDVVLDAVSMPAFEPGAVYYAAVTSTSCPNLKITMSASNVDNPPVPATTTSTTSASTGAGTGGGDAGGSGPIDKSLDRGCGCELAGDDVIPSWLGVGALVLGLGVVVGRRRRVA